MSEEQNLGGRPKIELNQEQIEKVEELAADLTTEQIADYLGFSRATFYEILKRQPEVLRRYKKGRTEQILSYTKKLKEKAFGIIDIKAVEKREIAAPDAACLMFFLKTQAGWRETQSIETKDITPKELPIININVNEKPAHRLED